MVEGNNSLVFSFTIFIYVGRTIFITGYSTTRLVDLFASETLVIQSLMLTGTAVILSPIIVTAFIHHYFHLLLNRFLPKIQAPEVMGVKGTFPTLVSWWEGLYSWLVMVMSFLMTFTFVIPAVPILNESRDSSLISGQLGMIFPLLWLFSAAFLFQVEYLYKNLLIQSYTNHQNQSKKSKLSNPDSSHLIEQELNQMRTNLGMTVVHKKNQPNQTNRHTQK